MRSPTSTLRALPNWSAVPSNSEDDRLFMNQRLAFYAQCVAGLSAVFYVWNFLLFTTLPIPIVAFVAHPGMLLHLLGISLYAGIWLACRRGKRSPIALNVLDVGGMIGGMIIYAVMITFTPASRDQTLILIIIAMSGVVLHAVVVPGTWRRSFWLSAGSMSPSVIVSYVVLRATPPAPPWSPLMSTAYNLMWASVAVAIAVVASHIIYGLSERVRRADELGQYTLEQKLGAGGMGVVYRARHALLRRPTAVKLLPADRAGERNVRRFEREVQLTSLLTHPNTIAIYDYGNTPDGVFYYAMEYLEGFTLEDLVRHDGPQPAARVVHLLKQVCGALHEAHGTGLIHRDIKPANLMLCIRGGAPDQLKVLDFGLVKELEKDAAGSGDKLDIVGTPMYMAPEAISTPDAVDARADLYALGAVGYQLLTGVPVFEGATVLELCMKQVHVAPPPPSSRTDRPIPPDLEKLLLSCLAKNRDERPSSASAITRALADLDLPLWTDARAAEWWAARAPLLRTEVDDSRAKDPSAGPRTVAVDLLAR